MESRHRPAHVHTRRPGRQAGDGRISRTDGTRLHVVRLAGCVHGRQVRHRTRGGGQGLDRQGGRHRPATRRAALVRLRRRRDDVQ